MPENRLLHANVHALRRLVQKDQLQRRLKPLGEHDLSLIAGRPLPNLWERLVAKSLTFTRFHLGHADLSSRPWRQSVDTVVGGIMDGCLKVPLEETFPFGEARAMLDRLASRQVAGKLILAVNPG
jgi:NADPH:quinone reductase-like Zn-dependent oxidoreductase